MDYGLVKEQIEKLLVTVSDEANAYAIASCINRLKRIADYHDLINILSLKGEEKAQQQIDILQDYIQYEEVCIIKTLAPFNIELMPSCIRTLASSSFDFSPAFAIPVSDSASILHPYKNKNDTSLILCTDLFRDYDDWLVLLSLIIAAKYQNIFIVTSNEVNGECASVTASYLPALLQMSEDMHGFMPQITIYRGLESFDFANNKHEPPKEYDARMRIAKADFGIPSAVNNYSDLYESIKQLKESNQAFDILSIGKVADHDIVCLLLDALQCQPNKDIILGAKPMAKGTNTNVPFHHLMHIRDHCVMLDSRYGNASLIRKTMFQPAINLTWSWMPASACMTNTNPMALLNTEAFNPGEKFLYHLLSLLYEKAKYSTATKLIADRTLTHLADLNYPTGGFYDMYALAAALCTDLQYEEKEIYFIADEHSYERPTCSYEKANDEKNISTKVAVRYPNLQKLKNLFMSHY